MNGLRRLSKNMVITSLVSFRYLVYCYLLSDVEQGEPESDGTIPALHREPIGDVYERFPEWDHPEDSKSDIVKAIDELIDENLIYIDENDNVVLGEYRGKKLFTFEIRNRISDLAENLLYDALESYRKMSKGRFRYVKSKIDGLMEKGIEQLSPLDFTELHGYLYEIYTGGEIYIIRNKSEYYQTNNILKAYDKFTTFAILVNGVLEFDKYKKKGVPTLTLVSVLKDEIFGELSRTSDKSKEYMRKEENDGGDF